MTKICGLVSNGPDPVLSEILEKMYNASWQENHIRREMWHDSYAGLGHFNIGAVNTEPQPLFTTDGNGAIVYCGMIFDYTHLKKDLIAKGATFSLKDNDAEFMLHFLGQGGLEHLSRINGIFSLACWDRINRKLTLVNDRYGYRPIYYYHNPEKEKFFFSSDLRGVLESGYISWEINWEACSTFLHFGHHLGNMTSFRNIFVLPPASVLTCVNNQVLIESYWDPCSIPVNEHMKYPEAVEGSVHYFSESMKRRNEGISSSKMVFLSGGLDSRRIAAELKHQGGEFKTYTTRGFNTLTSNRILAAQVAAALGVPNQFVNLPSHNFLLRYWPRCNALLDYETNLHQWLLPLVESLPLRAGVNFDGIAGDIIFNGVLRVSNFNSTEKFAIAQTASMAKLALLIMPKPLDFSIFRSDFRKNLSWEPVFSQIQTELQRLQTTPNQLTLFYLLNRTRRAIALSPMKLILSQAECCLPYLDKDLFEFMLSIPPAMKVSHSLRADTIQKAYPELTRVDYTKYIKPNHRTDQHAEDIRYYSQKREFLYHNIREHFGQHNWLFNNYRTVPRIVKDVLNSCWRPSHISPLFSAAFLVWFEWLEKYFSQGPIRKDNRKRNDRNE